MICPMTSPGRSPLKYSVPQLPLALVSRLSSGVSSCTSSMGGVSFPPAHQPGCFRLFTWKDTPPASRPRSTTFGYTSGRAWFAVHRTSRPRTTGPLGCAYRVHARSGRPGRLQCGTDQHVGVENDAISRHQPGARPAGRPSNLARRPRPRVGRGCRSTDPTRRHAAARTVASRRPPDGCRKPTSPSSAGGSATGSETAP